MMISVFVLISFVLIFNNLPSGGTIVPSNCKFTYEPMENKPRHILVTIHSRDIYWQSVTIGGANIKAYGHKDELTVTDHKDGKYTFIVNHVVSWTSLDVVINDQQVSVGIPFEYWPKREQQDQIFIILWAIMLGYVVCAACYIVICWLYIKCKNYIGNI